MTPSTVRVYGRCKDSPNYFCVGQLLPNSRRDFQATIEAGYRLAQQYVEAVFPDAETWQMRAYVMIGVSHA